MNAISAKPPPLAPSRAAALDAWRNGNPSAVAVSGEDVLREAAACATLTDTADGPRFDDTFAGLAEFIADLPF